MSENIGFTGTREKPTTIQLDWLTAKLVEFWKEEGTWFHHGDCIGADTEAHRIAFNIGYSIAIHPPTHNKFRSYCPADIIYSEQYYTDSNRSIVNICTTLLALPKGPRPDSLRGQGTWSTVEYALHLGKPTWICMPDGKIL